MYQSIYHKVYRKQLMIFYSLLTVKRKKGLPFILHRWFV